MRILVGISNGLLKDGKYIPSGFMEQFITELSKVGNDVLVYVPNRFQSVMFCGNNPMIENIDISQLESDIRNFNPELIITFNNTIYNNIVNITDCPIVVWGADSEYFWNSKDIIKSNLDRYYFFCFSHQEMKPRQKYFGIPDNRIFLIKPATNIKNIKMDKDKNISFIGSFFQTSAKFQDFIEKWRSNPDLLKLINNFRTYFVNKNNVLDGVQNQDLIKDFQSIPETEYSIFFSQEKRTLILSALTDMGLHIWGNWDWQNIRSFLPSLYACVHPETATSVAENEWVYNKSKICININHDQSVNGMNFRICDVLASSGALISSFSPFVREQFSGLDIPMFNDQYEARDICKKYLDDEHLRQDFVEKSNDIINNGWRWEHRFKDMSDILNLDVSNKKTCKIKRLFCSKKPGGIVYLEPKTKDL